MRANHLTTVPRQRGGFSREARPGPARVGTGTPAWVGVCSQRQLPLPPEPGFPRRSLGGCERKEVQYAPPRSAPPPPLPARPPRGCVSSCGPRSSPERFKGPSGPAPGGPRPAAPPAGTWSPRSPGPGAGAPPETTTPEPPQQCHGRNVGGAPSPGDLGARGDGPDTSDTEI